MGMSLVDSKSQKVTLHCFISQTKGMNVRSNIMETAPDCSCVKLVWTSLNCLF